MKWKSEEDEWGDGGTNDKSDESAGEKAGEGEEKAFTAILVPLLQPPFECNFFNSGNNVTDSHRSHTSAQQTDGTLLNLRLVK